LQIAVVSPFVDRRHGTERAVAELIERLAGTYSCEVHLFAQQVADLSLTPADSSGQTSRGSVLWHRVPSIPGPQLLRFVSWFLLNRLQRFGKTFDVVLSPGINCADADFIIVHALFRRLADIHRLSPAEIPNLVFPRRVHRRLYYGLLSALERRIYSDHRVALAAVSRRTASFLEEYFGHKNVQVVHNGVDTSIFSQEARTARRERARERLQFQSGDFVLLLIGNDWATKGLHTVLEAMALLSKLPLRLLIVGNDLLAPHLRVATRLGLSDRCRWEPSGQDVLDCYASADAYVSPSREDSFSLPVLEAMACGLPAITSSAAGAAELISDAADGFVLRDPTDAGALARILEKLYASSSLRQSIGAAAVATARKYTWDANAAAVWQLLCATRNRREREA